ncbi:MAG: DUF1289 domain-containing protein [Gammaproteobacteria bacterium]|nr:DUF1289 domain-containing protein [Gammaproteobacteria bacterium]
MTDRPDSQDTPIKSPCIGICTLDRETSVCIGCFRNLDEIIDWTAFSEEEKRRVLIHCRTRQKELEDGKNPQK